VARVVLLVAVVLHIDAAIQLTRIARAARPQDYAERRPQVSTVASRSLRWGGVILAAFIVFHILHMTTGTVHPSFAPGDVYHNLVAGFRVWPVAVFYLVAMAALGLHLYHGVWSSARTLGIARPAPHPLHRPVAVVVAVVVAAGFALIPIAVLAGWLR
jgi:succinate dehydrogenase / fumarate reductase cytochrome b subunit